MKLLFVTQNKHKAEEIKSILPNPIEIITLKDLGDSFDIPETELTLEGNARLKAEYGVNTHQIDSFSDDTGLEIEALSGRPGVFSARYAGEACNFEDNVKKVLSEMKDIPHRQARFRTVIALFLKGQIYYFEGIINGKIAEEPCGEKGFGYDPIFIPEGYNCSFAQMDFNLKNQISHRGLAIQKMVEFLKLQ
jgi:XTP/dITP diphosphohydrolase